MNLQRKYITFVEVEMISARIPGALREISRLGFSVYHIRITDDVTCYFRISEKEYRNLKPLLEKKGDCIRLCKSSDLRVFLQTVLKHPIMVCVLLFFFFLSIHLPTKVLFIHIEGNQLITEKEILEAAEKYGISFGAKRNNINSEKAKIGILSDIPELKWVGITTSGCVASISVEERSIDQTHDLLNSVTRIVAERDGYVTFGEVEQGNALFQTGQLVRRGQTLISGYIDCGPFIRAVRSKGEIYAQTNRSISVLMDKECVLRTQKTERKRKISLCIRKKRINLWKDSGISDTICDRMYEEYPITLPGGFKLPVSVCVETFSTWETIESAVSPQAAEIRMMEFAHHILKQQMIAGTIRKADEIFSTGQNVFTMYGVYVCEEMIGREQPEQIGDTNGKNT